MKIRHDEMYLHGDDHAVNGTTAKYLVAKFNTVDVPGARQEAERLTPTYLCG